MINSEEFSKMLSFELDIVKTQTAGLSQEDSLLQPEPGGNCLNWVMGHLVVNLIDILQVLEGKMPEDLPNVSRYRIGSEPILCGKEGMLTLEELLEAYILMNKKVLNQLAEMAEDDFEEEIDFWQGKSRRGYVAFFYFFHNTYHLGQLEYLRNLAGKTEKII